MPSASLSFRLPEDQDAFDVAQNGQRYKDALDAIDNHLRNRIKYGQLTAEIEAALQGVRYELHRIADDLRVELH